MNERALVVLDNGTRIVVGDSVEGVGVALDCAQREGETFTMLASGTIVRVSKVLAVLPWGREPAIGPSVRDWMKPLDN